MPNGILPVMFTGFDPGLPLERARTIPNTWYASAEVAAAEREAVFARTWQLVGRAEQVAAPGAFLTADIAGEPVLVVRGEDGVLRAFFNVCRHRAAPIKTESCGQAAKLRCHYHGWTYDLAGKLRGTPEFDGVEEFPKEGNGLVPMAVAEWGPFGFVHLTQPAEPLADFLRPLPGWVESRGGFGNLTWKARRTYDLACNWKVYVDNYLDGGYHVNTVHPALAGVLDYREYKTVCDGKTVVQSAPLKPAEGDAGRTRTGDLAAYWWVYPNLMLNLYSGVMDTNLVLPLGPDRCRVVFDFYFAAGTPDDFVRESVAVADQVQAEDVGVCEEVQRGLNSRSYTTGRFSVKRENGGYYFHQRLGRALLGSGGSLGG
ncbi:MAG: Rieske 2Fe-2S domain-containing protein [Gemmataceae bacterium]|nr:Rieske 2Fe-2S domain-containing protein [Gemmataceae bacterium]